MKRKPFITFLFVPVVLVFLSISCKKDKTTVQPLAIICTSNISDYTDTTVLCGGEITSDEGSAVIERGVCWSINSTPTIDDNRTIDGSGAGSFTSNLSQLIPNTSYFVRAYATNSGGTSYGNALSFKTLEKGTVLDIDGNIYHSVKIGDQVWMVENLKVTKYTDGSEIPNVSDNTEWANKTTAAYCWYNNDVDNKNIYGALYNGYAIKNNMAPKGWHVANEDDITVLYNFIGALNGGMLKEDGTAHWNSPNTGANNQTGFTALPGGERSGTSGSFSSLGDAGIWFIDITNSDDNGVFTLSYNSVNLDIAVSVSNKNGHSLRCIKD